MGSIVLCMTGAIHTCMLYTIVTVGCSASTGGNNDNSVRFRCKLKKFGKSATKGRIL